MIIELDDSFEDRYTVKTFLDLATGRDTLPLPDYPEHDLDDWRNLFLFARKWDSPQIIYTLRTHLRAVACESPEACHAIFVTGALMDDEALCATAIRHAGNTTWPASKQTKSVLNEVAEGECMDPNSWSAQRYIETPPLYTWVLKRAFDCSHYGTNKAKKFLELMKEYKGEPRPPELRAALTEQIKALIIKRRNNLFPPALTFRLR